MSTSIVFNGGSLSSRPPKLVFNWNLTYGAAFWVVLFFFFFLNFLQFLLTSLIPCNHELQSFSQLSMCIVDSG